MATSVIEICNNALQDLGEDPISSLVEGNKAARLCNQRWPSVRDAVLRAHPWNCAMSQAELAANLGAPLWKWRCRYELPADFLRIVGVVDSRQNEVARWEIQGRHILCDEDAPIYIAYVRRETDPQRFDALLSEAFSARLAAVLAYPLTGSTSLAREYWDVYNEKVLEARGVDAREGVAESVAPNAWLTAKLGRG
ncbi:hypothetical protein [Paucidesulfovibrio longus]|uniref:hypothetical protein n=1 Tax=Paucidesulfovibrio longus TaxID=889 RepID=UPI0003B32D9A|nr:hypothetical protein [Paucidesulfovibrio longus]